MDRVIGRSQNDLLSLIHILSSILNQYGIDMGDITQLAAADKELRNLKIGQQLSWTLTADGELQLSLIHI